MPKTTDYLELSLPLGSERADINVINDDFKIIDSYTNAEHTERVEAENTLQANINTENSRAIIKENALEVSINNETTRATEKENSISEDLTAEVERATAEESTLQSNIEAESSRASEQEQIAINLAQSETTRATKAEDTINQTITDNKPIWDDKYTKTEIDNKFSALETNIDWKEAVDTYDDIATTYPEPDDGWTVNVKDTDYTYRYNGTEWVAISANAIPEATESVNGLMTTTQVKKLDGIASGAEVNQNAFSNIVVGDTTVSADSKTDTLTLASGSNITITPDATNDKVTISAKDTTYSAGTGIGLSGTTFSNSGVRSITQDSSDGHKLTINTNGTSSTITIPDNNTTYSSKSAVSGGTDVSLVTTGEKYTWNQKGSGGGDVTGPSSSTDSHIATFNGTTGKTIKDSGYTIATSVPSGAKFTDTVTTASTTGSGNAVTAISASNGALTVTKGTTFSTTDTKNTAGSTDSSSKLFLIGATSQSANPQTYSQDTAYVGTDGCLYSGGTKVLTSHQDISGKQDKTDSSLETESNTVVGAINEINSNLIALKNIKVGTITHTFSSVSANTFAKATENVDISDKIILGGCGVSVGGSENSYFGMGVIYPTTGDVAIKVFNHTSSAQSDVSIIFTYTYLDK